MTDQAVILALETATSSCSAALQRDGRVWQHSEVGSNIHSQVLLEMVKELFGRAQIEAPQLDAVAVGQGPGSFTGLRIGVGVAQGVAYGTGCPMIGVSSLDALANQASFDGRVIAAIDARMGEVYWAEYDKTSQGLTRLSQLQVTPPEQIMPMSEQAYQLLGNAWKEYTERFAPTLFELGTVDSVNIYPNAGSLLALATTAYNNNETIAAINFAPEYVRDDVAKKPSK